MSRKTKIGDIYQWQQSLEELRDERHCRPPGFFMPYHFVLMALLLKEAAAEELHLPEEFREYASRLKLWEAIGLTSPITVKPQPTGSRYHPITPLKTDADIGNAAENLSTMLTLNSKSCSEETTNDLYAMLSELLGNCLHHARSEDGLHGLACAQTWYQDSRAQFAIADSGIGIRKSLEENMDLAKRLRTSNACKLASQYGISSKLNRGHAGYGLTIARDMALNTSQSMLFVQSGNEALLIDNRKETEIATFPNTLPGTLVIFEWDMSTKLDLSAVYKNWPKMKGDDSDDFF